MSWMTELVYVGIYYYLSISILFINYTFVVISPYIKDKEISIRQG